MKKLTQIIIATIISMILIYFLGIQFINMWVYEKFNISYDCSLLFFRGNLYFLILTFLSTLPAWCIFFNDIFKKKIKNNNSYSTMQSQRDIKKNLILIHFNRNGLYITPLDKMKILKNEMKLNLEKSFYNFYLNNESLYWLHLQDIKFKKMKKYKVGDDETYFRTGLPIITKTGKIWCDPTDSHSLIVGTTNSGKTFSIILILIQLTRLAKQSAVIVDVKGELSRMTAQDFINDGYTAYFIDFITPESSDCWNPLHLAAVEWKKENERIEKEKARIVELLNEKEKIHHLHYGDSIPFDPYKAIGDNENGDPLINPATGEILTYPDYSKASEYIIDVCNSICDDPTAKEKVWNNMASRLMRGIIYLLMEEGNEEFINFESVKRILDLGDLPIPGTKSTYLKEYVYKYRKAGDLSYETLSEYLEAPATTKNSIKSVFGERIDAIILSQQIKNMTAKNDIDFENIGNKKTVIFLKVHDEKSTYYPLVNLFMRQFCEVQIKLARKNPKERLKVPIDIIWDEFGNSPTYEGIKNLLTAGRSRGIRVTMVIQGYDQLNERYGDNGSKTIKNNCMNTVYLLSGDNMTLKEISDRCGTKRVYRNGKEEKEPVFTIDRLSHFKLGEALFLRQRENPFFTKLKAYDKYRIYKREANYVGRPKPKPIAKGWDIKKAYAFKQFKK